MKRSTKKSIVLALNSLFLMVFFQNCSKPPQKEEEEAAVSSSPISAPDTQLPIVECSINPTDPSCLPASCEFNGQSLAEGQNVVSYQNSAVPFGSTCVNEVRTCQRGVLSGSYVYGSCSVDAPASCLYNGQTILHGDSIFSFQNSTVAYGESCISEDRTCNNGNLSGSYAFDTCMVSSPSNCLFNGQSVSHDASVIAFEFSTTPYGTSCVQELRTCTNGALSGSYNFATCNQEAPQSCLFNGESVAHGQNVIGFQSSSVAEGSTCTQEVRTCDNGILSGSYSFASCNIEAPSSCLFVDQTIADGQSVVAFEWDVVPYGTSCNQQSRTCSNGALSGTYSFNSCVVAPPINCSFNGQEVVHGSSVTAFQSSVVPFGSSCTAESRLCNNGSLSGSYTNSTCSGEVPTGSCDFNGQTVLDGSNVTAFATATVAYGSSCLSETRTCSKGILSGSYTVSSCTVDPPASCSFDGLTIASGSSVAAYKTSVPGKNGCQTQTRTCTNGSLSGSFRYSSCQ